MSSSDPHGDRCSRIPRSLEQRVADREERFRRAHAVAAEAVTVSPEERAAFVASHPDCLCNEFAELMIGMARELRSESPRDSARCAHLAVASVEAVAATGKSDGEDVRVLAWAELGNSHRILGDLKSSGIAFHHARERLHDASDPLTQAEVLSLEGSYWTYRQEHEKSLSLLRRATRLQRRYGTHHATGRLQIKQSEPLRCLGRYNEAIDLIESGLQLVEPRREPKLTLAGIHNLAYCLILAGAHGAAIQILRRYEPAYEAFADPRLQVRRTWLEAEALAAAGQAEQAEVVYGRARDAFAVLDCPYEVALISLDLTVLFAECGRWEDVERTASETVAICQAHGVDAEGLAAAQVLKEAAARRQASANTIGALVSAVRQHLTPRGFISSG